MAWGFHRFGLHFRGIPYIVVRQAKTNSPEIWRNRNIALPGAQCAPLQGYAVGAPQRAASWTHPAAPGQTGRKKDRLGRRSGGLIGVYDVVLNHIVQALLRRLPRTLIWTTVNRSDSP